MEHTKETVGIHNSEFFDNIGQVLSKHPDIDLRDVFSKGQMRSKRWLVNQLIDLNKPLGTVFICAGWYGTLASFLFESKLNIKKIRSFDVDDTCEDIAEDFNRAKLIDDWQFKAATCDIHRITYPYKYVTYKGNGTPVELIDMPDTIINTSCEHIKNFDRWYDKIPDGLLVALQSNNYYNVPEHINCVDNEVQLAIQAPMKDVLYMGSLHLKKYSRFMVIGYK